MRWLALSGYTTIALDDLLAVRRGGSLPSRPVIITFDDGFRDCVEYAVPILQAHGFRATFYLVAGLIGKTSEWLLAERGFELPLMDSPTARQLEEDGIEFGTHSMSHPRLTDIGVEACRTELMQSRQRLEDQLGHRVPHLAYPFGLYNDSVRSLAAECGYESACSTRIGLSDVDDDLLALHRVPVNGEESFFDFICRLSTAYPVRETMLRMANITTRQLTLRGK
jgi:peptidoglycan/xylan/chitin deacetylase (PgdA/CDA1 family)